MRKYENPFQKYNQYADGGFEWQDDCLNEIQYENNVIISSPTGSGKTRVFLNWAREKKERPIIITAPIKALSNQRFRELEEAGFVVGLETGDIKNVPENCEFLCCTQEIYTNKYAELENITLIMDEFHYIFENPSRARTYIDALKNSKAKNMLLCSATLGDIYELTEYVEKVSQREFFTYENYSRLTSLLYEGEIVQEDISNALIVAFSRKGIFSILEKLAAVRDNKSEEECSEILQLAEENEIESEFIIDYAKIGLAGYFGSMLPKEKKFIEICFEQGLIDTVVGTDALALGVNFPVENVVFAQLAKGYTGTISKNLFEQLSGRAGRKGYYDEGHVFYCDDLLLSASGYGVGILYEQLLEQPNENISISLTPNIKDILTGKTTCEEEAAFISEYSTVNVDEEIKLEKIREIIQYIKENAFENEVNKIVYLRLKNGFDDEYDYGEKEYNYYDQDKDIDDEEDIYFNEEDFFDYYAESEDAIKLKEELMRKKEEFDRMISRVYFDEFSPEENCSIFANILCGTDPDIILKEYAESKSFYKMLQFRKYVMSLPKEYRKGLTKINEKIRKIDRTAIEGDRGKISPKSISSQLEKEGRMSKRNVMKELKEQEAILRMEERVGIINQQLKIEDEYGLEWY